MPTSDVRAAASFRDPSGFIFVTDGKVRRQVNLVYKDYYEMLMSSGLYGELVDKGLLIEHEETDTPPPVPELAHKVLTPRTVDFISYPYEWCFSQLKDAALTTLRIQKRAFARGMVLKDASAYNVQFVDGRPVFIDTLSFEPYREGEPWVAYRQFCQHFLAPLALMSYRDVRLGKLLRIHLDGIPLDLASSLLPRRTKLRLSLLMHLHWHARSQQRYAGATSVAPKKRKIGRLGFQGIVDSLESAVRRLEWKPAGTEWGDYYDDTNYSPDALDQKGRIIDEFLAILSPTTVWDLGANTGRFSRIATARDIHTISFDVDPAAVEKNYLAVKSRGEKNILPLLLDLTNPTPAIGWANRERMSVLHRGPADTAMVLALVHHLAISNNVPFDRIASFLAGICRSLIIEWVPKGDSQVNRLLATREDVFGDYTRDQFEERFDKDFHVDESRPIEGTERVLYLMRKK